MVLDHTPPRCRCLPGRRLELFRSLSRASAASAQPCLGRPHPCLAHGPGGGAAEACGRIAQRRPRMAVGLDDPRSRRGRHGAVRAGSSQETGSAGWAAQIPAVTLPRPRGRRQPCPPRVIPQPLPAPSGGGRRRPRRSRSVGCCRPSFLEELDPSGVGVRLRRRSRSVGCRRPHLLPSAAGSPGGLCLSSPCSRGGDGSWRCVDRSLRQSVADRDSRTEAPGGCCRCAARPRSAGRRCRAGAPQGSYRDRMLRRLERPPRDSAGGARGAVVAVGAAGAAMAHSTRGHSLPRGVGTGCSAVSAPTRCSADDDDTGGGRCRGCRRGSSANGGSGGSRDNTGKSGIGCGGGEGCSAGNDANEVAGCRHTTAPTDDSGGRSGSGCGGVSRVRAAACRGAGARWP